MAYVVCGGRGSLGAAGLPNAASLVHDHTLLECSGSSLSYTHVGLGRTAG